MAGWDADDVTSLVGGIVAIVIGIITSLQGAVIHDIRTTIDNRFKDRHLRIVPVAVQGEKAPQEIADAIDMLNDLLDTDLIILARGGGSLEDLNAFNSEIVARAIYNSKIPIVSAVGHETDFTIADFTADMRAPTPTAAAEIALPHKSDLQYYLKDRRRNMMSVMHHQIESVRQTIDFISRRLKHPRDRFKQLQLRWEDLNNRLYRSFDNRMNHANERLKYSKLRLAQAEPLKQLIQTKRKHEVLHNKMLNIIDKIFSSNKHRIDTHAHALKAYNPNHVLKRGYSITRTVDVKPKLVTHSKSVAPAQILEILLARGQLTVEVKKN
jgi:exodeoxyribonuclease VII large subunit